jgi:hypothetical protein
MFLHPEGVERAQPGVSTPGTPFAGGTLKGRQSKRRHNAGQTRTHLSPLSVRTICLDGSQG